jgi:hypothetical protein
VQAGTIAVGFKITPTVTGTRFRMPVYRLVGKAKR